MKNTLVLGIGNILMGDEGVGVWVTQSLMKKKNLPDVEVVDGGTGGFHLLDYFQDYERVILVDATMDDNPPGTINLLRPKFSSDYPTTLTAHDIGLKDLLDALYLMDKQPEILLFTISISSVEGVTLDLSPQIRNAIPKAVQKILDYLNSSG